MKRIMVLGCGGSAGINYIKALRLAPEKFFIVGVDVNKYYIEMAPVDRKYLVSHSKGQENEYIKTLNKIIKKERIDFVHAQPDPEVRILSDNRDIIKAKTLLPSPKAVEISHDKWKTFLVLEKAQVPVAYTLKLKDEASLKEAFKQIKGTIWLRASSGHGGKASLPVTSFEQAKMWVSYWLNSEK